MIGFTIRKYPDIDNFVPIIHNLAKSKKKILIISLSFSENFRNDFRVKYIMKKYKNIFYEELGDLLNLNFFQKFIINTEYYILKKNFIFKISNYLLQKTNLNYAIKNFLFNKNIILKKKYTIEKLIIDHLLPQKLFFFNKFFKLIKQKKIPILSLPAGLPLYTKHPKPWDIAKKEINELSKYVDILVIQHKYWLKEINDFKKIDTKKVKILGSVRYTNEWRKILNRICPKQNLKSIKGKINVVYMDSNNPSHIDFPKLKQKTLDILSQNKNIDLKFKPHPRSNKIYVDLPDKVEICKDIESINLIKWADVVLGDISAIMIECLLQKKRYISLSYLRKNKYTMLYDKYKICEEARKIDHLMNIILRRRINKFYSKNKMSKFLKDFVYYPNNNVIEKYCRLILS